MLMICIILIAVLFFRIFTLLARVAWKLTKGIVLIGLFPIAGIIALLCGAAVLALPVLAIGVIIALIVKN